MFQCSQGPRVVQLKRNGSSHLAFTSTAHSLYNKVCSDAVGVARHQSSHRALLEVIDSPGTALQRERDVDVAHDAKDKAGLLW